MVSIPNTNVIPWATYPGACRYPSAAEGGPRPPSRLQALIRFEGSPGRPCPNFMSAAADRPQPCAVYPHEPGQQWHGAGRARTGAGYEHR